MDTNGTYQMPAHGWTCFHCGETFTKEGAARDHFGNDQGDQSACVMFDELGTRGVVMALRRAVSLSRRQGGKIEHLEYLLHGEAIDYQRITGMRAAHDTACEIESLRGQLIAAEAVITDIRKRWPALVDAAQSRICQISHQ